MFLQYLKNSNLTKKLLILSIACTCGYGVYAIYKKVNQLPTYNKMDPIKVHTQKINKRFLMQREIFPAKLEADESVTIISEVSGRIKHLNIDEGQIVQEGTVLVQLDDSQEQAAYNGYLAEVAKAQAYLEKAKILIENGDIPAHTLKDIEADLAVSIAKQEQSSAALKKMKIVAPFTGVVGLKKVSQGAHVATQHPITQLMKINPLRVKFSVSADRAPYIFQGNSIQIFVGTDPLPIEGTITAKEPNVNDHNNMIDIIAQIDNSAKLFMPGQYAKVNLMTSKEEEVIAAPEVAIASDEQENHWMFIVKDNIAVKVNVEIGVRKGEGFVEIINGLNVNDEIIMDIGDKRNVRLVDGTSVVIVNDE